MGRTGGRGGQPSVQPVLPFLPLLPLMNKIFESAMIALDAIWSAKLRSFMTVLGNIVAVTSIIAVVSLIQGLNQSVTKAILSQAGADSFSIQQFPVTRTDEDIYGGIVRPFTANAPHERR